jgi:hypothetical protein
MSIANRAWLAEASSTRWDRGSASAENPPALFSQLGWQEAERHCHLSDAQFLR